MIRTIIWFIWFVLSLLISLPFSLRVKYLIKKNKIEESEALPGLSGDRARKLTFTFSGDGFLYHMVRIMMGTLLEVGLHKREAEDIPAVFDEGRRERAGELVPAKGLTLMEVRYL